MADPSPPLKLSAEATISTTAELRWSTPEDDGGFPLGFYFVERSLEGVVLSIAVVDGGTEYTVAPTVTITGGGGTGATATSTIDSGAVDSITVTSGGTAYTSAPTVTITAPGITATATATTDGDEVNSITVDDGGSGYTSPPTVTITGGNGSGATATAVLLDDAVDSIAITNGGTGYTSVPAVTIDPPGITATATATISDDSFSFIAATLASVTAFTDDTLFPRNNPTYRVIALNVEPELSSPSNEASTTTSTSEAQTIKDLLFDEWSLTGELSKTVVDNMTEVVNFLDRDQVPGNKKTKMVTVQKINELGNENIVEHPKFFEQSDTFEITCFLQVPDSAEDVFSVWIDLMQQMTGEVSRILKTRFSPSEDTGEFFSTSTGWTKDDTFLPDDAMLVRTLRFTLTRIASNSEEVFLGFGGVLLFDFSESKGDSLPTSDFMYSQIERVQIVQGWRNIPYITTDSPSTTAIPNFFRGSFSGRFTCRMQLKKSDITPTTLNSLAEIFLPQANGELGTAVFFHITPNTETLPAFLSESVPVNITNVEKIAENERLVEFTISGNLTGPTTFSITGNMLYENIDTMAYEDEEEMAYG